MVAAGTHSLNTAMAPFLTGHAVKCLCLQQHNAVNVLGVLAGKCNLIVSMLAPVAPFQGFPG